MIKPNPSQAAASDLEVSGKTSPDTGKVLPFVPATRSRSILRSSNVSSHWKIASSSRPRIAMVSTHGYVAANPPLGAADTGGQVVYVIELSKHLAMLGYDVDIWTRRFENQPEVDVVNENVRIIRVPCGGNAFIPKEYLYESLASWVQNAIRYINLHQLSYEFVNSHYWDAGIAGRELSTLLHVPHLHTPHSLGIWKMRQMESDFPEDRDKFEKLYNFNVRNREEKRLYHDADQIIATTPIQMDMLHEDYEVPLEKIRMVMPGYDETRFFPVDEASRSEIRKRLGFEGKVVLALGRLARNKGYDLLIRAFSEVIARVPDAKLYLAVGGEKISERECIVLDECKSLVKTLGLEKSVTFAGWISDEELPDIYRAADVFALSSRYEPFGMTVIEAMACGTPVVATTHGGFWRILQFGVTGLFADSLDAVDLGITLAKPLMYPHLWNELSVHGANSAQLSFTWQGVARELLTGLHAETPATLDNVAESHLLTLQESC